MTTLDDYWPPVEPREAPETPRRHRHVWKYVPVWKADGSEIESWWWCTAHEPWVKRDETKSRRARNNRKRGNRIQRQRIVGLGGKNLAGNNPNLDGLGVMFRYESKSGGSFPERLYRWLKGIPVQAGQTAVLIVTDAPGPGHRARSVVVVDYDEWRLLHGETP